MRAPCAHWTSGGAKFPLRRLALFGKFSGQNHDCETKLRQISQVSGLTTQRLPIQQSHARRADIPTQAVWVRHQIGLRVLQTAQPISYCFPQGTNGTDRHPPCLFPDLDFDSPAQSPASYGCCSSGLNAPCRANPEEGPAGIRHCKTSSPDTRSTAVRTSQSSVTEPGSPKSWVEWDSRG